MKLQNGDLQQFQLNASNMFIFFIFQDLVNTIENKEWPPPALVRLMATVSLLLLLFWFILLRLLGLFVDKFGMIILIIHDIFITMYYEYLIEELTFFFFFITLP